MLILALDTSTAQGGVAVLDRENVLSASIWTRETSHSELLTSQIEDTLRAASHGLKDVSLIALGRGPGSFTGIRIAVNAARTLGYALNVPIAMFDTDEILAAAVLRHDLPLLTVINAQKNSVFASWHRYDSTSKQWRRTNPPQLTTPEELAQGLVGPHLVVGDGYEVLVAEAASTFVAACVRDSSVSDLPHPSSLGLLAWATRDSRPPIVWKDAQALYIRASGAEEKLRETQGK